MDECISTMNTMAVFSCEILLTECVNIKITEMPRATDMHDRVARDTISLITERWRILQDI